MRGASLFVFALLLLFQGATLDDKLNVDVLFESLCPDSLQFIRNQLHPHWRALSPYINLKLVPFGKSSSLAGGAKFVCQHGAAECAGNRILSCALARLKQDAQVEYTACFMGAYKRDTPDGLIPAQQCAQAVGLPFDDVLQCYESKEGTQHQLQAELETTRTSPGFVPTILYNGEFDQELQDASLVDFRGVVCQLIKFAASGVCQSFPEISSSFQFH